MRWTRSTRTFLTVLAATSLLAFSACSDDDGGGGNNGGNNDAGDVQMDSGMDGGMDADQDADMDTGEDADMDSGEDAQMDGGMDADQDAQMDADQDAADLCDGVTCDQPDDTCDGDTAVTYTGAGTCDPADGTCDFSGVETRVDCTATNEVCVAGACETPDYSVNAGDLIVTEVMQNPSAVGDTSGEYFEVYNTSPRTLHINGLEFTDENNDSFTVTDPNSDPIAIDPHSYFVFGVNADMSTNGGVTVDFEYSGMDLGNKTDAIVIMNGADEIDRIGWDDGATFPDPNGASMQFGAEYDPATDDNNVGANWCLSRDPIDPSNVDSDFGTPGAANVDCTLPTAVIDVYQLQQDPSTSNNPVVGQSVEISGVVVTAIDGSDGFWVEETAGGKYSGAYVNRGGVTDTVAVGDTVDIEGSYSEAYGVTTVDLTAVTVTSSGATITPDEVLSGDLGVDTEPWEGVLVTVQEPGVTDTNPDGSSDYGEFRIDNAIRVDDQLFDYDANVTNPANCDAFDSLSGVVHHTFGNYKILPRDANDFPTPTSGTTTGSTGSVDISGNAYDPQVLCVDAGATVTWTNSDSVDHTVTERNPITDNATATPAFDLQITGGGSNTATQDFTEAGTYPYLCTIHPTMMGRVIVLE